LKSFPSRVPRHLPAVRPVGRTNSPELSGPFNDIPRTSPVRSGLSRPASVPLSGFLNLSAVSWPTRASWPCFVPQPFLGFLPSESSPRRNRAPLSGPPAPLQLSTDVLGRTAGALSPPAFTDAHAFTWLPGSPTMAMSALSTAPRRRFPVALDSAQQNRPVPPLHLLRSLVPPTSPFTPQPSFPAPAADPLLGFCPSRAFSSHASDPRPARLESRAHTLARRLQRTTRRASRPLESGESVPTLKR
jgi:hypothetical protein